MIICFIIILLIIIIYRIYKYNVTNFNIFPTDASNDYQLMNLTEEYNYPTCTPGCLSIRDNSKLLPYVKYNISDNRCIHNTNKDVTTIKLNDVLNYKIPPSSILGFNSCSYDVNTMIKPLTYKILPNQIMNLQFWYDASDINTLTFQNKEIDYNQAQGIDKWNDKSGHNNHLIIDDKPEYKIYWHPTYYPPIAGIDENTAIGFSMFSMKNNYAFQSQSFTIISIHTVDSWGWSQKLFWTVAFNISSRECLFPLEGFIDAEGTLINIDIYLPEYSNNPQDTWITAVRCKQYPNPTLLFKGWSSTYPKGINVINEVKYSPTFTFDGGFGIGDYNRDSYDGFVSELMGYDRALTDSELQDIADYLLTKWNV